MTIERIARKREIIISIDDYCEEPFEKTDVSYFNNELSKMLMDYDIEITKVEIRDVKEEK
jgi:hypothetical protein